MNSNRKAGLFQPLTFCLKCRAAAGKRPQLGPIAGRQINPPQSGRIRLDEAGAADVWLTQLRQVDQLVINTADGPVGLHDEQHESSNQRGRRTMLRRGRSTSSPSTTDWTPAN